MQNPQGLPLSSACEVIKSIFQLQMSDSSESDSSDSPGCEWNCDFSVASSYGSEVQDCRTRKYQPQIQGNAWVLRCQITKKQAGPRIILLYGRGLSLQARRGGQQIH
jgi:hypothetical protein